MSKIKMLQDVVQDLRSLTDSLEALANVIEEPEGTQIDVVRTEPAAIVPEQTAESVPAANPQQTAEPQQTAAETAPAAPKPPTLVELRAFVAARSTPQTRPKIRALLAGHGVAKLTDLPESAYLDLMREVEAL